MRSKVFIGFGLIIGMFSLINCITGCKKDSKPKIDIPPDYGSLILGTWSLTIEKDETYKSGVLTKTTIDTISNFTQAFNKDKSGNYSLSGNLVQNFTYSIKSDTLSIFEPGEGGGVGGMSTIKSITANSMEIDSQGVLYDDYTYSSVLLYSR